MSPVETTNGWTGGQYSFYRIVFGSYLLVHFVHLMPWSAEVFSDIGVLADKSINQMLYLFPNVLALWDSPGFVLALLIVAACASVAFAIGWFDRTAALVIFYIWACLFGRNPLIMNPSLHFVGWLLIAHALLPKRPYGSWSARGRVDPDGGWRLPQPIHRVAWIVMALSYSYSGYHKLSSPSWREGTAVEWVLENPLARPSLIQEMLLSLPPSILLVLTWGALTFEVLFGPLALFRRLRPWLWLGMLLMQVSLMVLMDFVDLSMGMVILHLFTFDPRWVRPVAIEEKVTLFYDGACGLCHRAVRFVLAEDRTGAVCALAPLQGASLQGASLPGTQSDPDSVPDTIVLRRADGTLLVRSAAVLCIMGRLGGLWRVVAIAMRCIPRMVLDLGYRGIARVRKRLFRQPEGLCPIIPGHLRERFVAD